MNNRKAISTDINPMAVFLVNSLISSVDFDELSAAFARVKTEYQKKEPITEADIQKALTKYPYPQGLELPKGSDVETVEQLFSNKQLAQLGLLKSIIKKIEKLRKNETDSIVELFKFICLKLPEWYKDKDLPIIDSKFNEIIEQIKIQKNGNTASKSSDTIGAINRILEKKGLLS